MVAPEGDVATDRGVCASCGCSLAERDAFALGGERRCLRCTLRYRPLLKRSARIALIVGTLLVLINQGTFFVELSFPASLWWKIPLTYSVPFIVATWGALSSARS